MKNKWLSIIVGSLALGAAVAAHADASSDATEKTVVTLENQWLESEKTNNADMAAPLFAETYIANGPDGVTEDKAQTIADAKARKFILTKYEDVKVRVYGDTAIATGAWKGQGTESSGKPFSEHLRWTDTWIKMPDGKWLVVASHYSAIKAKK